MTTESIYFVNKNIGCTSIVVFYCFNYLMNIWHQTSFLIILKKVTLNHDFVIYIFLEYYKDSFSFFFSVQTSNLSFQWYFIHSSRLSESGFMKVPLVSNRLLLSYKFSIDEVTS